MVNNVGKIVASILLWCCNVQFASITLSITDGRGRGMQEVAMGVPFTVAIALDGDAINDKIKEIHGIEQCQITGRVSNIHIINNHKTVSQLYTAFIKRPGTYTIGPVITDNGISNSVTIDVKKSSGSAEQSMPLFARLSTNKQRVFVGEKIECTLEIYIKDLANEIQRIVPPDASDCSMGEPMGPTTSTQTINGIKYTCCAWHWDLFPQKAGEITVDACQINYNAPIDNPVAQQLSLWGHAMSMPKRVYSNDVTVSVEDLPPYAYPVHGIGEFKRFNAHLNPASAKEGDGMVLLLELEGKANFAQIDAPILEGIPEEFKWYESKQYIEDNQTSGTQKKCFEYIVQGMKPGEWEIPKQQFTYFDTVHKKYKTMHTRPITVTIKPRELVQKKLSENSQDTAHSLQVNLDQTDDIRPIFTQQAASSYAWIIPWWFFCLLLLMPVVGIGAKKLYELVTKKTLSATQGTKAYADARSMVHLAQQRKDYKQLYPIFISLFSKRLARSPAHISESVIEDVLSKSAISEAHIKEWRHFLSTVSALIFGGQTVQKSSDELFTQAVRWIDFFEKRI